MSNFRTTKEYRLWRALVIRRDTVCQSCGSMKSRHAHHIKCASYHKDLVYDVDNGITLCSDCHKMLHCDLKSSYRMKCTDKDLYNYLTIAYTFMEMFK